jgi:hypothetical protein
MSLKEAPDSLGPLAEQLRQLGDIARYASSLIKSQRVGDSSIARIGMTVHISQALSV